MRIQTDGCDADREGQLGDPFDTNSTTVDYDAFNDDESQGAGPATHNCSKIYYFSKYEKPSSGGKNEARSDSLVDR